MTSILTKHYKEQETILPQQNDAAREANATVLYSIINALFNYYTKT